MPARKTPLAARSGMTRLVMADALWVLSFAAIWGLLIALWNTWWAIPLGALFLCHLGGLSEFMHQTVHLNLFARSRRWNRALGKVAAALIGVDFDTYRSFHLDHHRYANTPADPERPFYRAPKYLALTEGWRDLTPWGKIARVPGIAGYVAGALASFGSDVRFVRAVRWAVPIALALSGVLLGLPWYLIAARMIAVWYLPLFLLLFVDIVFAQSEHYGTGDAETVGANGVVPNDAQYALSWNLKVPAPIEFFLLKRNIHAEHHLVPGLHWTQARDGGADRELRFGDYLRMLWKQGPRA